MVTKSLQHHAVDWWKIHLPKRPWGYRLTYNARIYNITNTTNATTTTYIAAHLLSLLILVLPLRVLLLLLKRLMLKRRGLKLSCLKLGRLKLMWNFKLMYLGGLNRGWILRYRLLALLPFTNILWLIKSPQIVFHFHFKIKRPDTIMDLRKITMQKLTPCWFIVHWSSSLGDKLSQLTSSSLWPLLVL